ncbi:PA4642 family protein [Pseudomonas sp. FME51]|uniref:PA4642 family protein n=1 Tax=Pseudomonas sp. FME51 TaxID=2742609 RepID=UPI00299F8D4E|nr:PA4642 family protein [Pseudomonas sp. FME51]
MRKDKKKVVGEPMSDEQVAVFLSFRPRDADESVDMYMLTRAYRGLRAHDFARFLDMFQAAGHDVNAIGADGRTMLQILREHAQAEDYVAAMEAVGARSIDA